MQKIYSCSIISKEVRCQFQYDFFPERYGSAKGTRTPVSQSENLVSLPLDDSATTVTTYTSN